MPLIKLVYRLFVAWSFACLFVVAVNNCPYRLWAAMFCRGHYGPTTWERIRWGRDPSLWGQSDD